MAMARSKLAKVARSLCCRSSRENTTTASVNILVDVTVSANPEHLLWVCEENNAIAILIDPRRLTPRRCERLRKTWQAQPVYAVVVILESLSQGGNSSQPSLEFLPWDQKYRVLRSSYHVG
jgi:hypothetical protein